MEHFLNSNSRLFKKMFIIKTNSLPLYPTEYDTFEFLNQNYEIIKKASHSWNDETQADLPQMDISGLVVSGCPPFSDLNFNG